MKIQFRIDGVPIPKGRPKFSRRGPYVKTYTPKKTQTWEDFIRWQSLPYKPPNPHDGPVEMSLTFYLPRPKSLPKKVVIHQKKPDIDNLTKCVSDATEGIFFKNDSQIFRLSIEKVYTELTPGVDIEMNLI